MKSAEWNDLIVRMDAKLDVLNARMDRHSELTEGRFKSVNEKLDFLTEKIHDNEITVVKETGATNTKIAAMSGTISFLVAILGSWVKSKLFGGN